METAAVAPAQLKLAMSVQEEVPMALILALSSVVMALSYQWRTVMMVMQ